MSGHTPGPWTWNNYCNDVSPEDPQACVLVSHGTASEVMPTVEIIELEEDFSVDPANARLIAAAPELLDALKSVLESAVDLRHIAAHSQGSEMDEREWEAEFDQARAAIAKATGSAS